MDVEVATGIETDTTGSISRRFRMQDKLVGRFHSNFHKKEKKRKIYR
jgi:hypothetical protein